MAKELDATPEKRMVLSIIAEYDLKRSICELIDNAIDLWSKNRKQNLEIAIDLDDQQQTISIQDNAGGLEEAKLDHLVSPGKTTNAVSDDVIGYFGVGSKRAVIALAEDVSIHSRFRNEKTYTVHFDEHWINDEPSWRLPYQESVKPLHPHSTLVELCRLRIHLDYDEIENLRTHLSEVYAKFLEKGIEIKLNGTPIVSRVFDTEWAFPPKFEPKKFTNKIPVEDREVKAEIIAGLIDHPGDPDKSYGVFLYCNDRLIARGLTDFNVGFVSGMVGNPHYNISLVRTIVSLKGQSQDMPWDSSKSGINAKHPVFKAIQQNIIDVTSLYAKVSRSLQGNWEAEVFSHPAGEVTKEKLSNLAKIPKSYFPKPPPSRQKWFQKVLAQNVSVTSAKPWSLGLLESVIAVDALSKLPLEQKNRVAMILLDSTVEIAYKEYLVNEAAMGMGPFRRISENRADVQREVASRLPIDPVTIGKIDHFYKLRCDLIHQRATPNITDTQIADYRSIVENLLERMFGLQMN